MTRAKLRFIAAVGLGALAVSCIATWLVGSQLVGPVNHPVPLPVDFPAQLVSLPGPGHEIAGWWMDQGGDSLVVLLLHAIRSDRSSMLARARMLVGRGFSVLLIDLQAHGETPGEAITLGMREAADVQAARDWLKRTAPGRRIGVVGVSLGGAAVLLGPQPCGFDAVVLEAVYPRVSRAVENRVRIRLGPLAPALTPLLLVQLRLRLRVSPSDLQPIRSIARLGAPVLVVAGSDDRHTTLGESEELFREASEPKRMWVLGGAAHQDFLAADPQRYESEVVGFLVEHVGG
jgi:alpha-beta hydrolase superfamily lysophospholipase